MVHEKKENEGQRDGPSEANKQENKGERDGGPNASGMYKVGRQWEHKRGGFWDSRPSKRRREQEAAHQEPRTQKKEDTEESSTARTCEEQTRIV